MRKNIFLRTAAVILCLAIMMILPTGCAQRRKTLSIGFDKAFPPYTYEENGEFIGFDIEVAKAVCELEGWTAELKAINWDEKDNLLNSGEIDCIWSGFTINGRENDYTISDPYCDNTYVVVVPKSSDITDLKGLSEKVVGVQAASSGAEYLNNNEKGKALAQSFKLLSQFTDFGGAFESLEKGVIDAVIIDKSSGNYYAKNSKDELRILDEAVVDEKYGVAFKKGNTELCSIINADLKKLSENGTIKALAEKYGILDFVCI